MERLRTSPPQSLAGIHVQQVRDYQAQTVCPRGGTPQPLSPLPGQRLPPPGDLVILDLAIPGQFVAVRPSGTEPKIKFYLFASVPPEQMAHLDDSARAVHEQLARMEADLRALVAEV
jgi:phosphoglucomutase/phosphomannomutase